MATTACALATLRRLGNAPHPRLGAAKAEPCRPVVELAQLKSQTLLCLPRAEPPFQAISRHGVGLLRGPGALASDRNPSPNVDIAFLLKPCDSNESSVHPQHPQPVSVPQSIASPTAHGHPPARGISAVLTAPKPNARRSMPPPCLTSR